MKAAVVTDAYQINIEERPLPEVQNDEVLVKVACAGICGSDVTLFKGAHPFRKPPIIPGHEISGTVVKVGDDVHDHQAGERVMVNHAIPCGSCRFCQFDAPNVCPTKIYAGSPRMMGFFAQYVTVPASTLFRINDGVSDENAAMAEPLSVGFHVINRLQAIEPINRDDQSLAIIGTGTIGLLSLLAAKKRGYKKIICIDPLQHNLEVGKQFGAAAVFNSKESNVADKIRELTDGYGVSSTIITAAVPGILNMACSLTAIRGTMILLPMSKATLDMNIYDLVAKEQHLIGCRGIHRQDFADAVNLINTGFDFSPMISHVLPLNQSLYGFQLMVDRPDGENVIKVLIHPNE